jgi:hypothetical protein
VILDWVSFLTYPNLFEIKLLLLLFRKKVSFCANQLDIVYQYSVGQSINFSFKLLNIKEVNIFKVLKEAVKITMDTLKSFYFASF